MIFNTLSACLVNGTFLRFTLFSGLDSIEVSIDFLNFSGSTPKPSNVFIADPPPSRTKPKSKCSTPIKSCPRRKASSLENEITSFTLGENLASMFVLHFLSSLNYTQNRS